MTTSLEIDVTIINHVTIGSDHIMALLKIKFHERLKVKCEVRRDMQDNKKAREDINHDITLETIMASKSLKKFRIKQTQGQHRLLTFLVKHGR